MSFVQLMWGGSDGVDDGPLLRLQRLVIASCTEKSQRSSDWTLRPSADLGRARQLGIDAQIRSRLGEKAGEYFGELPEEKM